jgi:hypothetical protein
LEICHDELLAKANITSAIVAIIPRKSYWINFDPAKLMLQCMEKSRPYRGNIIRVALDPSMYLPHGHQLIQILQTFRPIQTQRKPANGKQWIYRTK